tara:strand:- start:464 stop:994 length:531 start_codon:yes stop_codon:yes gene_type:complete
MSALKVTQKVAKLASTGKAGPIALKSGYLRFVVKADAHIEVGMDPTVSTTNSLFVASGETVILKESVYSVPTVGVTNASAAIKFSVPDGMDSPFNVGDKVAVTGCAPAGINTTAATVSAVTGPDPIKGIHGQQITLNYGDATLAATDAAGEIRKVVYADVNCGGNVHISEVQIVGG